MLLVWIRGTSADTEQLVARFDRSPKPIYYSEDFLCAKWAEYCALRKVSEQKADPDDFVRWGYRQLVDHRLPVYAAIARGWGVTADAADIAAVSTPDEFTALIASALKAKG
jgi:hypothetical protein